MKVVNNGCAVSVSPCSRLRHCRYFIYIVMHILFVLRHRNVFNDQNSFSNTSIFLIPTNFIKCTLILYKSRLNLFDISIFD